MSNASKEPASFRSPPHPTSPSPPHTPHTAGTRSALALGVVGALGEELLAALIGSGRYATVHVGVEQPIGTATARFRPWVVGDGVVVADEAYVCITGAGALLPKASPMVRVRPDGAVAAARTARECGARRLVLVSPLSALLQLNAAAHTLSSADEVEIAGLGFESLLVVRPTSDAADAAAAAGNRVQRAVRSLARMVLEIMLPQQVLPLRARTAALAIMEAARRAGPGIHVLGAVELSLIVAETMPEALPKRARLR
jgi:hypothetical protein